MISLRCTTLNLSNLSNHSILRQIMEKDKKTTVVVKKFFADKNDKLNSESKNISIMGFKTRTLIERLFDKINNSLTAIKKIKPCCKVSTSEK